MGLTANRPDLIEIRPATPADLDLVTATIAAAYGPFAAQHGFPPIPMTEDYRPRIAAGEVHLIAVNGDITGNIVLEEHPDHCMIFSVAVDPHRHGQGLGVRLLRWAETHAIAAGKSEIRLYTNALMTKNIALYLSLGYREMGRRDNPRRPGWIVVDMTKSLAPASA